MDRHLKNNYLIVVLTGVIGVALLFSACESPSEVVLGSFDEEKSYFEFVMTNDDFFASEEEILNDPNNNNLGKAAFDGNGPEFRPWRTLRRVISIDRTFSHDFIDDTTAIVTMTRTMELRLFIYGQLPPRDGVVWRDTTVVKDFTEIARRKAMFIKVDNTGTAEDDWRLAAISLLEGGTPERDFDIDYMKLEFPGDRSFEYDNPLETFLRVGLGSRQVPTISLLNFRMDGYRLEITIESTNEDPETLYLRHGGVVGGQIGAAGYMRRMKIEQPAETYPGDNGVYVRTYVIDWHPLVDLHNPNPIQRGEEMRRGRFSTVIEAVSYETLHSLEAPVQTNYWGVPFIIN
jgi:hypothetical protein